MQPEFQRPAPSNLLNTLFALAVFLIPFNSIKGLEFVGELEMEAAFYVFAPIILLFGMHRLAMRTPVRSLDRSLTQFVTWVSLALFISFVFNVQDMLSNELRDRSGINKFITSLLVLYFGIGLMWVTSYLARITPNFFHRFVLRPTLWALPIVIAVGFIEMAGWRSNDFFNLYDHIAQFIRAGTWPNYSEGRLRSVTFEPPFLGMYLSAALLVISPLMQFSPRHIGTNLKTFITFALGMIVLFFTGARTAFVIMGAMFAFYWFYRPFLALRSNNMAIVTAMFFAIIVGLFFIIQNHHAMVNWVVSGDSVSNLSRYASNTAAMIIFTEHPVFGVGLGQYAFYAIDTMPSWGWFSYEINEWFLDSEAAWPPVFSAPARLAAEGGVILLLAWYSSLALLFIRMMKKVHLEHMRLGRLPVVGHTLLLSLIFVFMIGVAFDSFRNFWIWIFLGLSSAWLSMDNPEDHFSSTK